MGHHRYIVQWAMRSLDKKLQVVEQQSEWYYLQMLFETVKRIDIPSIE